MLVSNKVPPRTLVRCVRQDHGYWLNDTVPNVPKFEPGDIAWVTDHSGRPYEHFDAVTLKHGPVTTLDNDAWEVVDGPEV